MVAQAEFFDRTEIEVEITRSLPHIQSNDLANFKTISKLLTTNKRNFQQISGELHAFMIKLNSLIKQDQEPNGGEKK